MKNEEKTLPRLLDSMVPFFHAGGTAYVIDTGSTDNSVEIARSYPNVVVEERGDEFIWKLSKKEKEEFLGFVGEEEYKRWEEMFPDFSFFNYQAARNAVAKLPTTDWLLTVDCDEAFQTFDPLYVDMWCRTANPVDISSFPFIWGRNPSGGEVINNTVRIWNRNCSKWTRYVHEHIEGFSDIPGGKNESLDREKVFMEHFQNQEEVAVTVRKSRLFGLFKDWIDNPNVGRASHYLGREFMYFRMFEASIKMLDINLAHEPWDIQRMSSCIFKGDCYMNLNNDEKAKESWFHAWNHYDKTRLPSMRLANYYYFKKDHFKAKTWSEIALSTPFRVDYLEEPQNYRHYPHEILYWALYWMGDKAGSKRHYMKAIEYWPTNPKYLEEGKLFR